MPPVMSAAPIPAPLADALLLYAVFVIGAAATVTVYIAIDNARELWRRVLAALLIVGVLLAVSACVGMLIE